MSREILTYYYNGFEVRRNALTQRWTALPLGSDTNEGKITALDIDQLRAMIDAAALDTKPDPWELPRAAAAAKSAA